MKKVLTAALVLGLCGAAWATIKKAKDAPGWEKRVFTAEELKKYDGKEGRPPYAAVDGVVYDLSVVSYWKGGRHMNMHDAGMDLTRELKEQAPERIHGKGAVVKKLPRVGVMEGYSPKKGDKAEEKPPKASKPSKAAPKK